LCPTALTAFHFASNLHFSAQTKLLQDLLRANNLPEVFMNI